MAKQGMGKGEERRGNKAMGEKDEKEREKKLLPVLQLQLLNPASVPAAWLPAMLTVVPFSSPQGSQCWFSSIG